MTTRPAPVGTGPVDEARAAAARMCCQLADVFFLQLSARYLAAEPPGSGSLSFEIGPVEVRWVRRDREVIALLPFRVAVQVTSEGQPPKPLAEIVVAMRLSYAIRDDAAPTDDDLRHYVGVSGFMHAWPYLRAEVQELTTKLGLPPLLLPVIVSGQVPSMVRVGNPESLGPPQPKAAASEAATSDNTSAAHGGGTPAP